MGTDEELVPGELLKNTPREILGNKQMNINMYRMNNEEITNV